MELPKETYVVVKAQGVIGAIKEACSYYTELIDSKIVPEPIAVFDYIKNEKVWWI